MSILRSLPRAPDHHLLNPGLGREAEGKAGGFGYGFRTQEPLLARGSRGGAGEGGVDGAGVKLQDAQLRVFLLKRAGERAQGELRQCRGRPSGRCGSGRRMPTSRSAPGPDSPSPLPGARGRFRVHLEDGTELACLPVPAGSTAAPRRDFCRTARLACTPWSICPRASLWRRSAWRATARPSLPSWRASGCVGEEVNPPKISPRFSTGSSGKKLKTRGRIGLTPTRPPSIACYSYRSEPTLHFRP